MEVNPDIVASVASERSMKCSYSETPHMSVLSVTLRCQDEQLQGFGEENLAPSEDLLALNSRQVLRYRSYEYCLKMVCT